MNSSFFINNVVLLYCVHEFFLVMQGVLHDINVVLQLLHASVCLTLCIHL